jgi:hypothetical protein
MTLLEYMEMHLLYKRWKLLDQQWGLVREECQSYYPDAEFTLKEVSSINALIDTLGVIRRMYADK